MGASETKPIPSGNASRSSVAMASARRVLPTPPVPVEGHLLRRAHIDTVELAFALAVGAPIPVPTLIARLLSAHGKGSEQTAHTENGGSPQPGIPGGGSHTELIVLSVSLIAQRLTFDESSSPVLVAHAHPQ